MRYRTKQGTREVRPVRAWIRNVDWSGWIVALAVGVLVLAVVLAFACVQRRTAPLESQVASLTAETVELREDYAAAIVRASREASENAALETHVETLTAEVERLRSEVESLTTANRAISEDNDSLRSQPSVSRSSTTPQVSPAQSTSGVEQWRALVSKYFAAEYVDDALSVMRQESGGDQNAVNASSGCAGLFQQHPTYWAQRLADTEALYDVELSDSITDPEANVAVSAMLSNRGASWSHWSCQP